MMLDVYAGIINHVLDVSFKLGSSFQISVVHQGPLLIHISVNTSMLSSIAQFTRSSAVPGGLAGVTQRQWETVMV